VFGFFAIVTVHLGEKWRKGGESGVGQLEEKFLITSRNSSTKGAFAAKVSIKQSVIFIAHHIPNFPLGFISKLHPFLVVIKFALTGISIFRT
jgi:hypothetical protein